MYTSFFVLLIVFFGFFSSAHWVFAAGQSYTVCAGGCDFSSLTDALTSPGLGDDTITLTSGYSFNPAIETTTPYVPVGVTLQCDSGADTIGDSTEAQISWNIDSNTTIQNCTLDNVRMESSTKSNVTISGNTFVGSVNSQIFINATDGFNVSDNVGLQEFSMGSSDNGVVNNNTFECGNNSSCVRIVGYGAITDYTDSAQISNNVAITNNTITNHTVNTFGDWIYIGNGRNISITGNLVQSAVTTANNYITMITLQSAEVILENNTIIMPEKSAPADQVTWGINLRSDAELLDVEINHNTIVFGAQTSTANSQCLGLYDGGGHAQGTTAIDFSYNICYNSTGTPNGTGIGLSYPSADNNVTLNDSYNGFYNIQNAISDSNGILTSVDTTSVTSNPVFRTENLDTTDDYQVVPMSSYLDVSGTNDIGAYSAVRTNSYMIDQGCVVNYITCHSEFTSILNSVIKSGDTVTIGAGTYAPIAVPSGLDDITLQGAGATTIIDATGVAQGLSLTNLTNSTIKDLVIQNANTETYVYNMFSWAMSAGGTDYNTISPGALYSYGPTCSDSVFLTTPYTNVTGIDGIGTSSVGLFLVHIPDGAGPGVNLDITAYLPNSSGTTPAEVEASCGQPQSIFQHYVSNALILQPDGAYVYNAAAVANAGITLLGAGSAPFISKVITSDAGLHLYNSTGNEFSGIIFDGNNDDIYLNSGSMGNLFTDIAFSGVDHGIVSDALAANSVVDSMLSIPTVDVNGAGPVNIYATLNASVTKASDATPVVGAIITVKNAGGVILNTLTTDIAGVASDAVLTNSVNSSGIVSSNPVTFRVSATGFLSQTSSETISAPKSLAVFMVQGVDPVESSGGGGGGGSYYSVPMATTANVATSFNSPATAQTKALKAIIKKLSKTPNLKLGMTHPGVKLLQQFLNANGYVVAESGPGSRGAETLRFGNLTRSALIRFQKAHNIVPASGYFGPLTRQVMGTLD